MALVCPWAPGEGAEAERETFLKVIFEIRCQKCDIFGTRKRTNGILPVNCKVVNIIQVAVKWIGEIPI
jgi:hypothetical protein